MDNFFNISIEKTALASAIYAYEPDAVEDILSHLHEDLFYLPAHKNIYNAISMLYATGKPIDESFIQPVLMKEKQWDETAMIEVMSASGVSNITSYAQQLREYSRNRKLDQLATTMQRMIREDHASADNVQALVDMELQSLEENSGLCAPVTMRQAIADYKAMVEPPKINTGIRKIDEMLCGGFEPAQLIHLGGERNIGKTTLLKQILFNTSSAHDSLFFSFEMPKWKMAKYTMRMTGESDLSRYHIIDTKMMKSRDVMDVARMIRTMWRKHGIRFVLIDSKMKLTHKTFKGGSDSDRKGDIDAVLNSVVQETGIVLMMIVQISKEDGKNGVMSSYGSGLSDYEADMQMIMYKGENCVEVKVTKNRQEVQHEPAKIWLNTEELKFEDSVPYTVTVEYQEDRFESSGGMVKFEMPEIRA